MTERHSPETILAAWFDEGPMDLPDETRQAILTTIPATQQARRGPFAPRRLPTMYGFVRAAAAALIIGIVGTGTVALFVTRLGVGGPTSPTLSPSPSPSAAPTGPPGVFMTPSPLDGRAAAFPYPFSYHLPAGRGYVAGRVEGVPAYQFRIPTGPDSYTDGVIVREVQGGRTDPCREFSQVQPFAAGPEAVIDYLATVPTIELNDVHEITLDGRPAMQGMVRIGDPTAECQNLWLWNGIGSITQNMSWGIDVPIWVVAVGTSHVAIYTFVPPDRLAVAEEIVGSLRFDAPRPSPRPSGG
jgi:hypothetical protein